MGYRKLIRMLWIMCMGSMILYVLSGCGGKEDEKEKEWQPEDLVIQKEEPSEEKTESYAQEPLKAKIVEAANEP